MNDIPTLLHLLNLYAHKYHDYKQQYKLQFLILVSPFFFKDSFKDLFIHLKNVCYRLHKHQGPVLQIIVSLMSSLVVKMLTVLVSTVSNSQVFLLKKCE